MLQKEVITLEKITTEEYGSKTKRKAAYDEALNYIDRTRDNWKIQSRMNIKLGVRAMREKLLSENYGNNTNVPEAVQPPAPVAQPNSQAVNQSLIPPPSQGYSESTSQTQMESFTESQTLSQTDSQPQPVEHVEMECFNTQPTTSQQQRTQQQKNLTGKKEIEKRKEITEKETGFGRKTN